jgi:cobalt-zinc-cadmium efflux system membrane fusion protein
MGFGRVPVARWLAVAAKRSVLEFRLTTQRWLTVSATISLIAIGSVGAWTSGIFVGAAIAPDAAAQSQPTANPAPSSGAAVTGPILQLNEKQLDLIKVAPVGEHVFPVQQQAVGSIDFNEDLWVQVFPPYQGRIISPLVDIGDDVEKGQPLFTIDSPDLIQAESTLIGAAATYDQNNKELIRAQRLYNTQGTGGIAEKDLEAAVQGKLSAEGALKAARDAVRVFGKTEAEINGMVAKRQIDPALVTKSPIAGRITARNAQPGLFVQPGTAPAPYAVADISTMLMVANIPEIDTASIKLGQAVKVSVMARPGHAYEGKITTLFPNVDPNLHTLLVRSLIKDPRHELRSGMFARFVIVTADPVTATAVPVNGVVREGDGTMTVWVTSDRRHFAQRQVKIGLMNEGYHQILDGLSQGELVVIEGAVFLDNMLSPSES